jgi:hypothetical protein
VSPSISSARRSSVFTKAGMRPVASHPRGAKLAERLVLQGRLEEAEAILGDDENAETSLARVRLALARGDTGVAA